MSWSPDQLGEFDEDDINLDLQFDAPQWEDLEKEKELQEQGIIIDSNLHDDWFRQVHPLHEAKLDINQQGKGVVDRKGNKLSLEMSKCGPRLGSMDFDTKSGTRKPVQNGTSIGGTKQRKCWDLSGSKMNNISPRVADKQASTSRKRSTDSTDDMDKEIRAMLEAHNRRIMKQNAEYDENGRKIRKGTPETCHAPSSKETQDQAKSKNKRRSVNLTRPEIPKEAKQKRRSCFTLSTVQESSPKIVPSPSAITTTTTTTTTPAVYSYQTRSTISKNRVPLVTNTTTSTNRNNQSTLSKQRSFKTMEKPTLNRQKRKSSQASDAEQEIKDLIAQHNLKVAAKAKNKQK